MDGWVEVKVVFWIAHSNQKHLTNYYGFKKLYVTSSEGFARTQNFKHTNIQKKIFYSPWSS
jgi:hypothetical protein